MSDLRHVFEERKIRCTKQRLDVYEVLHACTCHPTAERLHRMVNDRSPGTSLATVYNTLEALCSAGLCRKIPTSDGGCRYDADMHDHLHVLTDDGRVLDVPQDLGERILAQLPRSCFELLESRLGVEVKQIDLRLMARGL